MNGEYTIKGVADHVYLFFNPVKSLLPVSRKTTKKSAATRSKTTYSHTHMVTFLLGVGGLSTVIIAGCLIWFLSLGIPDIRSAADFKPLLTTTVLDRHGKVIDRIFQENRYITGLASMPELLPLAFVAAEDARFFEHGGLDFHSILRAFINNLRSRSRSQGGSTITQQVTKALLLSGKKTYFRKFKEAILAYRLEKLLTKEEILYIYLNQIYFGRGAYGVEAAAREYFRKHASQLTLSEISLLAGLPQAPSRYSPTTHFKRARSRQRYVLNRMVDEEFITPETARRAYHAAIRLVSPPEIPPEMGYFTRPVRYRLEKKFGSRQLLRLGLTVSTGLDSTLQQAANRAIRNGVAAIHERRSAGERTGKPPQGALAAMDIATGEIRALIGGTDFTSSQYNRAVQARRRPGSVFKPIIYAAAFAAGLTPETIIDDEPLILPGPNGRLWRPRNFDNTYYGPTTLADGLIYSRNIVAIKLLKRTGFAPVINLARRLGITAPLTRELGLALGTSDISLLEMTGAYNAFAGGGLYRAPRFITAIRDAGGKPVHLDTPGPVRVLPAAVVRRLDFLLREVISKGTGRAARGLAGKSAGKTGTSDNNVDAWFIGYNDRLTTGVWFGHDRGKSLGKGETGGRAAAPVWREFMKRAQEKAP